MQSFEVNLKSVWNEKFSIWVKKNKKGQDGNVCIHNSKCIV